MLPRAVRELAHRGSGPAECHGDLGEAEAEHLVQQKTARSSGVSDSTTTSMATDTD